jgi:hypothetical protein
LEFAYCQNFFGFTLEFSAISFSICIFAFLTIPDGDIPQVLANFYSSVLTREPDGDIPQVLANFYSSVLTREPDGDILQVLANFYSSVLTREPDGDIPQVLDGY